jgi:tetratricopeptide (TPR) repeat protein
MFKKDPCTIIIIALIALYTSTLLPGSSYALIGIKEGDSPKDIVLDELNGKSVNVTELFGKKPVILVFWELTMDSSFVNYSLEELRFLNEIYDKYHKKYGLEIISIYTPEKEGDIPDSEIARVQNLIKLNKIAFPVLINTGFEVFREYGIIALPSTIMIDITGKIRFIYPSFPITAQSLFYEKIMELVGEPRVEHKKEEVKIDSHSERLYQYALQMYKRNMLEQAISPLKKSLEINPDNARAHNLMGVILWEKGNFEESVKEFKRAIELKGNNAPAYFNYGLTLFEEEKYDEAEQYFKQAVALNNKMAGTYYVLGLLYKKTGRPEKALNELNKALSLFEEDKTTVIIDNLQIIYRISTLYTLSELYSRSGDDKKALNLLQHAVRIALGLENESDKSRIYRSEDLMIYE